jgi:uncharacterized membrane protein
MTEPQEQEQVQPVAEEQAAPAPAEAAAPVPAAEELKAVAGVGFFVMAFNDEKAADQALDAMKQAKKQKQFYFEEAAVIRQDANGKVQYHETGDMGTGKGAGIGALVGGVLSLLGGPIGLALGAGIGAAAGALAASKDSGFRNESLNMVGIALKPGTSAVVAITSHDFLRAVQKQVPVERIREAVSNLASHLSDRLNEKKDVAIGILLTEDGLAVKEIAVNDESAEVVGAVITSDAIIAGSAIATKDGEAYQVVAATAEGVAYEVGVGTAEGAAIEAGVITEEGATIVSALAVPAAAADENKVEAEKPADAAAADAPAAEAPAADAPQA